MPVDYADWQRELQPSPDGLPDGWKCLQLWPKADKKKDQICRLFESPRGELFEKLEDCIKHEEDWQRSLEVAVKAYQKKHGKLKVATVLSWEGWSHELVPATDSNLKLPRYTAPCGQVFCRIKDIEAFLGKELLAQKGAAKLFFAKAVNKAKSSPEVEQPAKCPEAPTVAAASGAAEPGKHADGMQVSIAGPAAGSNAKCVSKRTSSVKDSIMQKKSKSSNSNEPLPATSETPPPSSHRAQACDVEGSHAADSKVDGDHDNAISKAQHFNTNNKTGNNDGTRSNSADCSGKDHDKSNCKNTTNKSKSSSCKKSRQTVGQKVLDEVLGTSQNSPASKRRESHGPHDGEGDSRDKSYAGTSMLTTARATWKRRLRHKAQDKGRQSIPFVACRPGAGGPADGSPASGSPDEKQQRPPAPTDPEDCAEAAATPPHKKQLAGTGLLSATKPDAASPKRRKLRKAEGDVAENGSKSQTRLSEAFGKQLKADVGTGTGCGDGVAQADVGDDEATFVDAQPSAQDHAGMDESQVASPKRRKKAGQQLLIKRQREVSKGQDLGSTVVEGQEGTSERQAGGLNRFFCKFRAKQRVLAGEHAEAKLAVQEAADASDLLAICLQEAADESEAALAGSDAGSELVAVDVADQDDPATVQRRSCDWQALFARGAKTTSSEDVGDAGQPGSESTADLATAAECPGAEKRSFDWQGSFARGAKPFEEISASHVVSFDDGEACGSKDVVSLDDGEACGSKDVAAEVSEQTAATKRPSKRKALLSLCWADRNAPTALKHLKPEKVWVRLRDWLTAWRPIPPSSSTGKTPDVSPALAALVTGPPGAGKTTAVRFLANKLRGHVVEYDLIDVEGRSFMENLAKKQRNGNQLPGNTVVVCNIAEQISQTQKDGLLKAVQASPSPVILVAAEGVITSKDTLWTSCLEVKVNLKEAVVEKLLQGVVKKEAAAVAQSTCAMIATACPRDLRQAIATAQLVSALPGGETAHLPQAAMAPLTACARLLRPESLAQDSVSSEPAKPLRVDEALELLALDEVLPGLLRWNCMSALTSVSPPAAKPSLLDESCEDVAIKLQNEDGHLPKHGKEQTLEMDDAPFVEQQHEEEQLQPRGDESSFEHGELSRENESAGEQSPKEQREMFEVRAGDETHSPATVQTEKQPELLHGRGQKEGQQDEDMTQDEQPQHPGTESQHVRSYCAVSHQEADSQFASRALQIHSQELEALENCSRISTLLACSDVAARQAELAAEQAGTMMCSQGPAAAEPLLLAMVSCEVHKYACRQKHLSSMAFEGEATSAPMNFQPRGRPPELVCPIPHEQLLSLSRQFCLPKVWVFERVFEWLEQNREAVARTPKQFRRWLHRQVQARYFPRQVTAQQTADGR